MINVQYTNFNQKSTRLIDDIYKLWEETFGEQYPIDKKLILQNTFYDTDVLEGASFVCKNDDELIGIIISKKLEHGVMKGNEDRVFINLLLAKQSDEQEEIYSQLINRATIKLKEKGVKNIQLFGDFNNYFPGVPQKSPSYRASMQANGFKGDHIVSDLYKKYPNHEIEEIHYLEGMSAGVIDQDQLQELLLFMQAEFPGRWAYEVEKYIEAGGNGREFVVLRKEGNIIGFCRVNDALSPMIWYNMNFNKRYNNQAGVGPLGVSLKYRGLGLGKTVTQAGINTLLERGHEEIIIDWTDLEAFYQKMGYNIVDKFYGMDMEITS